VFIESGAAWTTMTQTAKLTAADGARTDYFGWSVAVSGTTLVAGADYATVTSHGIGPGAAYVFVPSQGAGPAVTGISPQDGPSTGGTAVTITGTNLSKATAVKFGSVASKKFKSVSATTITATAPAGTAGIVDVTVTTANGTSATTAADQFTYLAAPTVTAVSPNQGPLTGGGTLTITGTGFTNVTAVKFGKTAAVIQSSTATQIIVTCPKGKAGAVDVIVTAAGGTSAVAAGDKYTYCAVPSVSKVAVAGSKTASGPTSGGTTVTITGKAFTGATKVLFGANLAKSFTVTSATSITAISPAGTGTVLIMVQTPAARRSRRPRAPLPMWHLWP